ncbi:MAG: insulinase family protein [Acidobacteriales bacterium]|nr:insulinase family protein [Terriglobales bacterium]
MKTPLVMFLLASGAFAQMRVVDMRGKSPLVTFRIVFTAGSAADPADKPGLANLTAEMLAGGGTRDLTYQQILDAMFPMAASVSSQVDKQMTTFSGATHVENLEAYYKLFRAMLLEPGWREDDFKRIRENTINYLRVTLRGYNDEELGKEVLYNEIYAGHPYGRHNAGTVAGLEKITLDDVKEFYRTHYTQVHLIAGLAGGYTPEFLERVKKDFRQLPAKGFAAKPLPPATPAGHTRLTIVDKDTRSVAYSLGFPIIVKRGHPDYPALLVAASWLGQHRMSGGRLYQRMRELRGLNYGDYAYIEYFPRGMFQFEPDPNLARSQQIFQIWIRPVDPATAHFAVRLALYEMDKLVREGLDQESFERTRNFVMKYAKLLTKTKSAELGYAIDSRFYRIPEYVSYLQAGLQKLTREDVNRAIRKHLGGGNVTIVAVARNCASLKSRILEEAPSPMAYNSPKPKELLEEDKTVSAWKVGLKPENVRIIDVEKVFE